MTQRTLRELIADLQESIVNGKMNCKTVEEAIKSLAQLGYKYDNEQFPPLNDTEAFTDTSGTSPSNLAEALLWKLGKWKSYKRFAENYTRDDSIPTKTDVVFFAFAKHLKDKKNPIYDQHAIRALWAICGNLSDQEKKKCRSLLFDKNDEWKQSGSGTETIECYDLFVRHINELVNDSNGATLGEMDRLLMPLGQAIKKSTKNYSEFHTICGWPSNG